MALTSRTKTPATLYDEATNVLQQQLSQVQASVRSRSAAARCPPFASRSILFSSINSGSALRMFARRWPPPMLTRPKASSIQTAFASPSIRTIRRRKHRPIAISSLPIATHAPSGYPASPRSMTASKTCGHWASITDSAPSSGSFLPRQARTSSRQRMRSRHAYPLSAPPFPPGLICISLSTGP